MNLFKLLFVSIVSCLLCFNFLEANSTREAFIKYPNKYFIESGSFMGEGIQMALDSGFENIYSIELAPHYYQHCVERFAAYSNVKLVEGDSGKILSEILKNIESPATFWLDGHYSCGVSAAKGDTFSPILAELDSISQHPIKTHTIMIDDVRLFGTIHFDFVTLEEIIQRLLKINPNYQIVFENGYVPYDIIVAYIPENQKKTSSK